jgi:branched-chain amino acid transport system permease protein
VRSKRYIYYLTVFVLLLLLPKILPTYHLILIESGLTFGIMALGFNLLLRYTGLLSFGHGALFATGAYTVGMIGKYLPDLFRIELLIPAALVASLVVSAVFGFICVRHTRIFFSILALALSMVLASLLVKLYNITGGSDGIHIELPLMFGRSFQGMRRFEFLSGPYYYVLVGLFVAAFAAMHCIVHSPFGKALQSIRDNEVRAEMIGIRVKRYRWYAFMLSGIFTGLGGALWSFVNGHVTPEVSEWVFSGEIVYMTLLGGFVVLEGPIVGAIIFTYLRLYAQSMTQYWMLIIGVTLVVLVLLLPEGISGGIAKLMKRLKSTEAGAR